MTRGLRINWLIVGIPSPCPSPLARHLAPYGTCTFATLDCFSLCAEPHRQKEIPPSAAKRIGVRPPQMTTPPPRGGAAVIASSDSPASEAAFELHSSRPGGFGSLSENHPVFIGLAERPFRLGEAHRLPKKVRVFIGARGASQGRDERKCEARKLPLAAQPMPARDGY